MLLHLILVSATIKILNTKVNEGTLFLGYNNSPYFVIFEYPEGVKFKEETSRSLNVKLNYYRNVYRRVFKVERNLYLKYKKFLCKEFDYDKIFEKGFLFKFWIIKGGIPEYIELLDWMPRPDFSIIFVGTISTGFLLCIILKAFRNKTLN